MHWPYTSRATEGVRAGVAEICKRSGRECCVKAWLMGRVKKGGEGVFFGFDSKPAMRSMRPLQNRYMGAGKAHLTYAPQALPCFASVRALVHVS